MSVSTIHRIKKSLNRHKAQRPFPKERPPLYYHLGNSGGLRRHEIYQGEFQVHATQGLGIPGRTAIAVHIGVVAVEAEVVGVAAIQFGRSVVTVVIRTTSH